MTAPHASLQALGWAIRSIVLAVLLAAASGCDRDAAVEPDPAPPPPARPPTAEAQAAALARKEKQLTDHLAVHPQDLDVQFTLANLYYDTERPHLAVPLYQEVLKHHDQPGIRTDLGTCYKRMGLLDQARAEYERVLSKNPGHIQATYNLAVVHETAGDGTRAAELWERVAAMAPGTPIAKVSLRHAALARKAAAAKTPAPASAAPSEKDAKP